jgi:hypothetical protein
VTVSWETDVESNSMVLFREQGTTEWIQVGASALTRVHQVQVFGLDPSKDYEFAVRSEACNGATTTDTNAGAGYDFFYPPLNAFVGYLTGVPEDQANKVAGNPTATFNSSAPTGEPPITQHGTAGANPDVPQNQLAVFWTGPVSQPILAGSEMAFEWYFTSRFGNVFVTTAELTIFAGNPLVKVHQQEIDLDVFLAATPNYNTHRITLQGTVADQMSIQLTTPFINNDFTAYYGAASTPSRFVVPDPNAPDLPLTGPVPPPSAGATNLQVPPTRRGPASAADIAAGTGICNVHQPNRPPNAVDDSATVAQGGMVDINVLANDTDADADTLTVTSFTQGANGSVSQNPNGTLKYTHNGSATSSDSFTYTISDGRGGTDTATVTITVTPINGPDLTVTQIKLSWDDDDDDDDGGPDPREGQNVKITATIKNIGNRNAPSSKTRFVLDGTTQLGLVNTPALAAGKSAKVSVTWDTHGQSGNHVITVTADANGAIVETNESNNSAQRNVRVRPNRVDDGDFEDDDDDDGHPDGWDDDDDDDGDDAGTTSWSQGGSHGAHSASIQGNGGNVALLGAPSWTSAPIPVIPGETLTLSMWVNATGASSAASAGLAYLGPAGELLGKVTLITAPLTTSGFQTLENTLVVPAGVAQVRVLLIGFAPTDLATNGTVTFDDVGLFGE